MTKRNLQSRAVITAGVDQIASDNTSGAAEILSRAGAVLGLLHAHSSELGIIDIELARQAVTETCVAIALAQPDMSPLLRLASAALSASRIAPGFEEALKSAEDAALNFIGQAERGARDSASHAAALIRDGATVFTHSRSSTVLAAFDEARREGRDFSVVATESRPMLEGRALAEALSRDGIRVTLIADAGASLAMERVDLILVGADKLTPSDLVNKIGTRMIALAALERGLPIYAVCDTSKFICEDYIGGAIRDKGTPGELWTDPTSGVVPVNYYFEPTPLAHFTGIITEHGALSIKDAARLAEEASIDSALVAALGVMRDRVK